MAKQQRRLVDIDGLAEYLHDTPRHIKRLIDTRAIPFKRVGPRFIRFDLDEIDAWIDETSVEAQEA